MSPSISNLHSESTESTCFMIYSHIYCSVQHALKRSYKVKASIRGSGTPTTVLQWRLSAASQRAIHFTDFIITRHRVWIHTAKWNSWETNGTWQILVCDSMLIFVLCEKEALSQIAVCVWWNVGVVVVVVGGFGGGGVGKERDIT